MIGFAGRNFFEKNKKSKLAVYQNRILNGYTLSIKQKRSVFMEKNICKQQAYDFGVKTVIVCKNIAEKYHEYDLTSQLKRSATSISANLNESQFASSRADFQNKLNISLKEANESKNWVNLLHDTSYMDDADYEELYPRILSIVSILTVSMKTLKSKIENPK